MKRILWVALSSLLVGGLAPVTVDAAEDRPYNLTGEGLALAGYDPVGYHDGAPVKGRPELTAVFQGVTYRFATQENRKRFEENPAMFEPAYGGWCAWAMLMGEKVDVDPKSYKIINGKTYLFYNGLFGNTLKKWNRKADGESEDALVNKADRHWQKLSDER